TEPVPHPSPNCCDPVCPRRTGAGGRAARLRPRRADWLRHGLPRASFIADRPPRELREWTRYRTPLIQERANEVNRLQKVLEGANIKLASVATDILGRSGRDMLEALVRGTPMRGAGPTGPRAAAREAPAARTGPCRAV